MQQCSSVDALIACFPGRSVTIASRMRITEPLGYLERGISRGDPYYIGLNGRSMIMDIIMNINTIICSAVITPTAATALQPTTMDDVEKIVWRKGKLEVVEINGGLA